MHLFGAGFHTARIRTGVGFGQAETADEFACGKPGQILLPLFVGAIGIDRIHHQRGLHRHHGPIAAVHPFDLAGDKAVSDIAGPKTTEVFRRGQTKQSSRAHFGENLRLDAFFGVGLADAGDKLVSRKSAGGVGQHTFVFAKLIDKIKRVFPIER